MNFLGAHTEELSGHAARLRSAAGDIDQLIDGVRGAVLAAPWEGPDAEDFKQGRLPEVVRAAEEVVQRLRHASDELEDHVEEQDRASDPEGTAVSATGDLPEPSPSPGPSPAPPPGGGEEGSGDRRGDPDGRGGRRVDRDEDRGSREGDGHFSHDWAGRAILDRYLSGGGDWTLDNDPTWRDYMMDNAENNTTEEGLGNRSRELNDQAIHDAIAHYEQTGETTMDHSQTTNAVLDNGEEIVGSQYLHGSNAEAGGFQYDATTTVTPNGDGTYTVAVDPTYTFNDRIDPNGQYVTDRVKSTFAEIITLGQADPYDIHISWDEPNTAVVDGQGNPVSQSGWPY